MQGHFGIEGWIVIGIYVAVMLSIGWFSSTKINDLADFLIAGRSMNRWQIGFSIVATWVSGTTMLALPASGYTNGLAIFFFGSCASLASGLWIGFYVVPLMRKANLMTVPEMLERWFGNEHRLLAILAVWARELAYVGSALVSIGICISYTTPLSYSEAVVIGAGITATYMLLGGQRAVIMGDLIQNTIIMGLTVYMVISSLILLGGWDSFTSQLSQRHKEFTSGYEISNLGAWFFMGLFQCFAYQALIQRGLSARSVKEAQAGFLIGGVLGAAWYVSIPLLGMLGYAFYGPGEKASDIFLILVNRQFSPLIYNVFVVMLMAALMSTLDGVLMSISSNFVVDIYKRFINPNCTNRQSVLASRISVVIALAIGLIFAFVFPVLMELLWIGTRIMVCTLAPVIAALCLYKPVRKARKTVLAAMILGMISTVLAFIFSSGAARSDVFVFWSVDPVYIGLPVNILTLTIGTFFEVIKANRLQLLTSSGLTSPVPADLRGSSRSDGR